MRVSIIFSSLLLLVKTESDGTPLKIDDIGIPTIVSSFRGRIFKDAKKALLLTNKDSGIVKCCDNDQIIKNYAIVVDLSFCKDGIKCNDEKSYYHEFSENHCTEGFPYGSGCASLAQVSDRTEHCKTFIDCKCFDGKSYCDSVVSDDKGCIDERSVKLNSEGVIVYNQDTGAKISEKRMYICMDDNNDVKMIKHWQSNNKLHVEIESKKSFSCEIRISNETCINTCIKSCKIDCKIPAHARSKESVSIACGNWIERIWLFRTEESVIHSTFSGHSKWTNLNKTITELFIFDLFIGYIVILAVYHIGGFIISNFNLIFVYIKHLCYNCFCNNKSYKKTNCEYCGFDMENIADAYLHSSYCESKLCPYCQSSIEYNRNHIMKCKKRESSIKEMSIAIKNADNQEKSKLNQKFKVEVYNKFKRFDKGLASLWILSLSLLLILMMSVPAYSLKMPCSHTMGETAFCDRDDMRAISGKSSEHHSFGFKELGFADKIKHSENLSPYQLNTLQRMKIDIFNDNKDSGESLSSTITDCSSDSNKCKLSGMVKWSGQICENQVISFEFIKDGMHNSMVHLFIVGVEHITLLEKQYATSCWRPDIKEIFSCTKSCKDVCNLKPKCPSKIFKKDHDTSWAHNPANCLTINDGCTCAEVTLKPDNEGNAVIYKSKAARMSAVICMTVNNLHIDCDIVGELGGFNLGKSRGTIDSWKSTLEIPETIIIKNEAIGNNKIKNAYYGTACKKSRCSLGEFGDYQFDENDSECNTTYHSDTDSIKAELQYHFATTPKWDISHPNCGFKNNDLKLLSEINSLKNHHVNVSEKTSSLSVVGSCVGEFSMTVELTGIEIYRIEDDSHMESFKVPYCMGEHSSVLGSICTFEVIIRNGHTGTVKISTDDSIIIQNDYQVVANGMSTFRKYMLVRGKHPYYKFCCHYKQQKICTNVMNNFTDPKVEFTTKHWETIINDKIDYISNCNNDWGFSCAWSRFLDVIRMIFRISLLIIITLIVVFVVYIFYIIYQKIIIRPKRGIVYNDDDIIRRIKYLRSNGWHND